MPTDFIRAPLSTSLATDMFAKQARPYSLPCRKYLQRAMDGGMEMCLSLSDPWIPNATFFICNALFLNLN